MLDMTHEVPESHAQRVITRTAPSLYLVPCADEKCCKAKLCCGGERHQCEQEGMPLGADGMGTPLSCLCSDHVFERCGVERVELGR